MTPISSSRPYFFLLALRFGVHDAAYKTAGMPLSRFFKILVFKNTCFSENPAFRKKKRDFDFTKTGISESEKPEFLLKNGILKISCSSGSRAYQPLVGLSNNVIV